jgi:hypothetical protein
MDNTNNQPAVPAKLTPEQIAWYSDCIIVTCTEGGFYTKEDYKRWSKYKHSGEHNRAEVTIEPHNICEYAFEDGDRLVEIRVTPEWLASRFTGELLKLLKGESKIPACYIGDLAKALAGDEDYIPDVVEAGALLQIAVYGEVVYG